MSANIKFGTSGWRAIIAEEFTVKNVRRAVVGIAGYVAGKNPNGPQVICGQRFQIHGRTLCERAESAGFSIRYHVPEKDGVLAGL